jgi:hypothetical protein
VPTGGESLEYGIMLPLIQICEQLRPTLYNVKSLAHKTSLPAVSHTDTGYTDARGFGSCLPPSLADRLHPTADVRKTAGAALAP